MPNITALIVVFRVISSLKRITEKKAPLSYKTTVSSLSQVDLRRQAKRQTSFQGRLARGQL